MSCEVINAREISFLLHGPNYVGKLVGMVYGYFDESHASKGIDENPQAFCGLIGHEETWTRVDHAWRSILEAPHWPKRVRRFHATDCVNANKEFEGWSYTLRHAMYTDLANTLIDSGLLACGVAVEPHAFELLPRHVKASMGDLELLMMQHAIQTTILQANFRYPSEEVGLVFDRDSDAVKRKAMWLHDRYRTNPTYSSWTSFATGSSYDLTMLQAADLMAHGSYRFHQECKEGTPPDFKVAPIMMRLVERMDTTGIIWTTDKLMDIFVRGAEITNAYGTREF